MIIDTTQTKIERQISAINPMWFSPICTPRWDVATERRKKHLTNQQKEEIIAQLLSTEEGKQQLVDAMVEPIRCGGLEYI